MFLVSCFYSNRHHDFVGLSEDPFCVPASFGSFNSLEFGSKKNSPASQIVSDSCVSPPNSNNFAPFREVNQVINVCRYIQKTAASRRIICGIHVCPSKRLSERQDEKPTSGADEIGWRKHKHVSLGSASLAVYGFGGLPFASTRDQRCLSKLRRNNSTATSGAPTKKNLSLSDSPSPQVFAD